MRIAHTYHGTDRNPKRRKPGGGGGGRGRGPDPQPGTHAPLQSGSPAARTGPGSARKNERTRGTHSSPCGTTHLTLTRRQKQKSRAISSTDARGDARGRSSPPPPSHSSLANVNSSRCIHSFNTVPGYPCHNIQYYKAVHKGRVLQQRCKFPKKKRQFAKKERFHISGQRATMINADRTQRF